MKRLLGMITAGASLLGLGCGGAPPEALTPEVSVEADVNGTTGDELVEAFFGVAVREDQPLLRDEDIDGDGNIDVIEDANNNGVLDPGEDLDGDGALDFINEDTNNNGVLEELPIDINQDGVIDANDAATIGIFVLVATAGGINCEQFTDAFINQADLAFDDTLFFLVGSQASLGAGIPAEFAQGNTVAQRNNDGDVVGLQTVFGQIVDGEVDPLNSAVDAQSTILRFDALGDTLDATITANLLGDGGQIFPLLSTFKNITACPALNDGLAAQLVGGNFFN